MTLQKDSEPRTVMVVDDDWLNRELLEAYLTAAGYRCITAQNGAAAVQLAQSDPPDLVLCDVQMPHMNGYEVCKRLKSDPRTQFVPIIMVTALHSDDEKLHAVEAGADDFVTKPFNSILLLTRVRSLLRIKQLHDEVEARNTLLREVLTRYLAEGVVETILTNPDRFLKLGGETRPVTVLFADIRGFTSFTESRTAQKVVETLNNIFPEMTRIIFAHQGTFDKFLGDAVMAFWGAPLPSDEDPLRAVQAAVEMRDTFYQLRGRGGNLLTDLGFGIGINTGDATVGNIGSEKVMDYTVIGDTVNIARRLQETAASGEILISEATYAIVKDRVQAKPFGPRNLYGRRDQVSIFALEKLV